MPQTDVGIDPVSRFDALLDEHTKKRSIDPAQISTAALPCVIDVMGGLGEDAGALVLTATVGHSIRAAAWPTDDKNITIERHADSRHDRATLPVATVKNADGALRDLCRSEKIDWSAPLFLALGRSGALAKLDKGLHIMIAESAPGAGDAGRDLVRIAAALSAVTGTKSDLTSAMALSQICADAAETVSGLRSMRAPLTALMRKSGPGLVQLRFQHSQTMCEALDLPEGIVVRGLVTRLERPTTHQRMVETRLCSEMGHRLILGLLQQDGAGIDLNAHRLASVTPSEFVRRYRDRMPSKITRDAFVKKCGALNGLDDGYANPKNTYKVRSRTEHHIYENERVHDFVTHLVRARRTSDPASLEKAGELMYASHWSHSQRCGIGGVEADQLSKLLRDRGPERGIYGAKVTGNGHGGELVVLMRDDETANAALDEAIEQARTQFGQQVHLYDDASPSSSSATAESAVTA